MKINNSIKTDCGEGFVLVEKLDSDNIVHISHFSYDEAIKVMASWWEMIHADGINVAAQIQMRRSQIKGEEHGR